MPPHERYTVDQVRTALELTGGLFTLAANKLGCAYNTVKNYVERYPELQEFLDEIEEFHLDIAEAEQIKAMRDGNLQAVQFYLRCKGGRRGYNETYKVNLRGTVEVTTRSDMVRLLAELPDDVRAQLEELAATVAADGDGSGDAGQQPADGGEGDE